MCNVPRGADVKSESDLQALITNSIFEQRGDFTAHALEDAVFRNLYDSCMIEKKALVQEMIQKTLMRFVLRSIVIQSTPDYRVAFE